MVDLPRGKILGGLEVQVTDRPVDAAEAEHFMRCPGCGGWIDCRDLAIVLGHHGPLPHPAEDGTN
jgi:hypothetical protein